MRFIPWLGATLAIVRASLAADSSPAPVTPTLLAGADSAVYRTLQPEPLRLHIFKPAGWQAGDRRAALVWFFGGGWTRGTPENSAFWAKWAAKEGLVGVAPDYRVKDRFGTSPLEAVADARAAVRWVQDHAAELGIDPQRVVVGGNSAGGHLALWTAIGRPPPGSTAAESPRHRPAALILTSAVSDTSKAIGYTPTRFGDQAEALSPVHQLDAKMPPVLAFHGDADQTVPQAQALALREKLRATGNVCEFVSVPGGSHNFGGELPEWRDKQLTMAAAFLKKHGLLP
jgi:acetyl esterase